MDTLIKLKYITNKFNHPILHEKNISIKDKEQIIFEVDEYEKLEVSFEYGAEIEKILIETYDEGLTEYSGGTLLVNVKGEEESLVPGIYEINLYLVEGTLLKVYFKVIPKNINEADLTKLIDYLNQYREGIALNYATKRANSGVQQMNSFLLDIEKCILDWEGIKQHIHQIVQAPSFETKKVYEYGSKLTKLDNRVIRKMCERGTYREGAKAFYQPRIIPQYDISDNERLIDALMQYGAVLKEILNEVSGMEIRQVEEIARLEEEYTGLEKKIGGLGKNYIISETWLTAQTNRYKYISVLVSKAKERSSHIQAIKDKIQLIYTEIQEAIQILQVEWGIQEGGYKSNAPIKDSRYRTVIDLLEQSSGVNTKLNLGNQDRGFTFKATELLFEYFCFVRIVDVLLQMGFEEVTTDNHNIHYMTEIPTESEYIYRKEHIKIRIQYDKEVTLDTNQIDALVSVNSHHRRPDITILLYENEVFKRALICEVKYRRKKYIYNSDWDTKVVKSMKDYKQLIYLREDQVITDAVKKVLLLYPNQGSPIEDKDRVSRQMFNFIPLKVSEQTVEETLLDELARFIEA